VERAGGQGESDYTVSVERLQGLDSRPAPPAAGMRHGYGRYVANSVTQDPSVWYYNVPRRPLTKKYSFPIIIIIIVIIIVIVIGRLQAGRSRVRDQMRRNFKFT
jgi:hypothetical protein